MFKLLAAQMLREAQEINLEASTSRFPKKPLGRDLVSEPIPEELRHLYILTQIKSEELGERQREWVAFDSESVSEQRLLAANRFIESLTTHQCVVNQFGDSLRFLHKKRPTDIFEIRAGWIAVWTSII